MSRLYNILNGIVSKITPSNQFAIEEHTIATNVSINGGGVYDGLSGTTVSKSGYYPLGIVGHKIVWVSGNTSYMTLTNLNLWGRTSGSAIVGVAVGNAGSATGKINIVAVVLWAKNIS